MNSKYRLVVMAALLLITLAHFSDPPSGIEIKDPRVGSAHRQRAKAFSFNLLFTLILRLVATALVISLAVVVGVVLFLFVIVNCCKWEVFVHLYRRTWNQSAKGEFILLLLLALASRIPFRLTHASPPNQLTPRNFRDIAVTHLTCLEGVKYYTDEVLRRMLLILANDVER